MNRGKILKKKYSKLFNQIILAFIDKQGLEYEDITYYDTYGFKHNDVFFHLDIILKDFEFDAPAGLVLDFLDYRLENKDKAPEELKSYKQFIKDRK